MSNSENNRKSLGTIIYTYFVIFTCILFLVIFTYGIIKVSFQPGDSSARITETVAYKLGAYLLKEQPSLEQMYTINRLIRYFAHISLFGVLGFMTGVVLFLIFRSTLLRLIAIIVDWAICFGLSYFTEYYKKFIPARHFSSGDVRANMIGSMIGICFMLICFALFEAVHARKK